MLLGVADDPELGTQFRGTGFEYMPGRLVRRRYGFAAVVMNDSSKNVVMVLLDGEIVESIFPDEFDAVYFGGTIKATAETKQWLVQRT